MKKPLDPKPRLTPEELRIKRERIIQIRAALASLRDRADETVRNASGLTDLILSHQQNLLSNTTIVRETAALLQHAVQNLDRIAQPILAEETKGTHTSHR